MLGLGSGFVARVAIRVPVGNTVSLVSVGNSAWCLAMCVHVCPCIFMCVFV